MKLKSYFSGTVEAAMELARKELGGEALLIHARPATPETRALGALEVVFGVPPRNPWPVIPGAPGEARGGAVAPAKPPDVAKLGDDVAELRREIRRLTELLAGMPPPAVPTPPAPLSAAAWEGELDSPLTRQLTRGAALEDLFDVDPTVGRPGCLRSVVVLVGPPGAGKTTTLIKLAVRYGLAARRAVHILSADVFRVAAAAQLQSLASILGIGCTMAATPAALIQALGEHPANDLLFIDTPGLGPRDMNECRDLAQLVGSHPEMDVHLVLPATLKPADLRHVIDRYEPFRAEKLLFTRIDESHSFGMLINESARRALPVSFLSTGQRIPDDLEPATKARLSALVRDWRVDAQTAGAAA